MSFQVRRLDGACGSDWGVAFTGIGGFAEPFLTGYLTGRWSQAARANWGILSFLQCLQVNRVRTWESPERMAGTRLGNETWERIWARARIDRCAMGAGG